MVIGLIGRFPGKKDDGIAGMGIGVAVPCELRRSLGILGAL